MMLLVEEKCSREGEEKKQKGSVNTEGVLSCCLTWLLLVAMDWNRKCVLGTLNKEVSGAGRYGNRLPLKWLCDPKSTMGKTWTDRCQ